MTFVIANRDAQEGVAALTDTGRTGDTSGEGGVMALATELVERPAVAGAMAGSGGEFERRVAVPARVGRCVCAAAGTGVGTALAFLADFTAGLRLCDNKTK